MSANDNSQRLHLNNFCRRLWSGQALVLDQRVRLEKGSMEGAKPTLDAIDDDVTDEDVDDILSNSSSEMDDFFGALAALGGGGSGWGMWR